MWFVAGKVAAMTVEQRQQFVYYFYEAERLWHAEQYADAFALFEFCYALNPDDAMTNRYLGHIYRGSQLVPQSLPFYRRAWEAAPKDCWEDYAVTLYNGGDAAQKAEAIQVMEQAGTLLPDDAEVWDHLRDAYIGVGKYKQAIGAQDKLDRIEGYSPYSAINRYRIYMLARDAKKAIKAIEDYLQEDPTNVQFQLYRMQLYEMIGRPAKQLIPIYQTILKLDPYNALVLNNYAYLLATTKGGDLHLAEQMSAKAVQAEPNSPTYLDTYAWVLYLTGQQTLAELYIRQAMSKIEGNEIPMEILRHYEQIIGNR